VLSRNFSISGPVLGGHYRVCSWRALAFSAGGDGGIVRVEVMLVMLVCARSSYFFGVVTTFMFRDGFFDYWTSSGTNNIET